MDVKQEPDEFNPDPEGEHWFDVPILHPNTYIKNEKNDGVCHTFENTSTDLTSVKYEADSERVDIKNEFAEYPMCPLNYGEPQPSSSYSECRPLDQVVAVGTILANETNLKSSWCMPEVEVTYEDIHIDEHGLKKEFKESKESIKNIPDIVKRNLIKNNSPPLATVGLKTNSVVNTRERRYKCDECDYSSVRSSSLKSHIMTHSDEKPFKCDKCNYSCRQSSNMKSHKMTHSGEKPFKCDNCNFSTTTPGNMNKHKKIHIGQKPFICDLCDFTCIQSGSLKRHKMIHSGEKPYKCDMCCYSCIQSGSMIIHKMTHSGEKRFKCDECNFSSIIAGSLKEHKMTHSGEKAYKCDVCNYSCIQSGNMKKHKMTHTRKNKG